MKYLKHFIENSSIEAICEKYNITNWSIDGGFVNIDGSVDLFNKELSELPLSFGKVTKSFFCSDNKLSSLKGAPHYIGVHFISYGNKLTSLKYAPKSIGNEFNCSYNKLITLKGAPEKVSGNFDCAHNNLVSLEGAPKSIGNEFNCSYNKLTSLEYLPKHLGGKLLCGQNKFYDVYNFDDVNDVEGSPVQTIYKYITNNNELLVSIDYFKDCRIIIGKDIYIDRFKEFLDSYGLDSNIDVNEIKKSGYKIK